MINLKRIRQQLLKFLTRHGYIYVQGEHWTLKHQRWLTSLQFDQPWLRDVFDSIFTELQHCNQRLASLDKQVEQLAQSEAYREPVGLLRCLHGIDTLTAISIITEIFDFGRFACAGQLMSYLGLTPSEASSGERQGKGSICKTGNKRARRLLNEAAWHYRHAHVISRALQTRRKGQPQWAIDIANRAGVRLPSNLDISVTGLRYSIKNSEIPGINIMQPCVPWLTNGLRSFWPCNGPAHHIMNMFLLTANVSTC